MECSRPTANATLDYDSNNSKADPLENDSAVFGVQLSPEARGPDPVVMQLVKATSNHKTETRRPKEPGKSSPHTKANRSSRSRHSFDTMGLPDVESSVSSPKSVPRRKTRETKRVSKVRLPLSPATSHSPPRVRPRSGKAKVNIGDNLKTIDLLSDDLNPAGATGVTRTRGMKRKRVIESEDESEPTAKKPKSDTAAVECTTPPRPIGSTYEERWNESKANPRHKIPPTLIDADDFEALGGGQVKPPATEKEPERSAKANIVKEEATRQPKACSSPQDGNAQSSTSECERVSSGIAVLYLMPELTPVLRPKGKNKAPSSTSPTRQHVIKAAQGALPPIVRISLPNPEAKDAKVIGRYCA